MLDRRAERHDAGIQLAAEQVHDQRTAAAIGDVLGPPAKRVGQKLAREMLGRVEARHADGGRPPAAQPRRIGGRVGQSGTRMGDQHLRRRGAEQDGREARKQWRRARRRHRLDRDERVVGDEDGLAIGRRADGCAGAEARSGAADVLDDDRLAEQSRESGRKGARKGVHATARREGHDRADRPHALRRAGRGCEGGGCDESLAASEHGQEPLEAIAQTTMPVFTVANESFLNLTITLCCFAAALCPARLGAPGAWRASPAEPPAGRHLLALCRRLFPAQSAACRGSRGTAPGPYRPTPPPSGSVPCPCTEAQDERPRRGEGPAPRRPHDAFRPDTHQQNHDP